MKKRERERERERERDTPGYQLASLRAKAAAIWEPEVPRGARDLGLSDACWDLGLPDVALDCRGPLDWIADAGAHVCERPHAHRLIE